MTKYKLPDYALQDYLACYAGARFLGCGRFHTSLPAVPPSPGKTASGDRYAVPDHRRTPRSVRPGLERGGTSSRLAKKQPQRAGMRPFCMGRRRRRIRRARL
jgi:hypothetical protein